MKNIWWCTKVKNIKSEVRGKNEVVSYNMSFEVNTRLKESSDGDTLIAVGIWFQICEAAEEKARQRFLSWNMQQYLASNNNKVHLSNRDISSQSVNIRIIRPFSHNDQGWWSPDCMVLHC